jgi:MYXO-CTERM domain-containing protein
LALTEGATSDATERFHWMSDGGEIYILVYFSDVEEEWTAGPAAGHFYFAHDGAGALVGGSVVLNSRDHAWATDGADDALDVQGVVTALIGRSLGITSAMEGNATFPRYAPGDTSKRVLGSDDEAAIHFLYPRSSVDCDVITPPQAECDGMPWPGDEPCPPLPATTPGDGGTAPPRDAGPIGSPDAGVPGADAGDGGGDDGGCSVALGERSSGAPAWIALLGLVGIAARRRR